MPAVEYSHIAKPNVHAIQMAGGEQAFEVAAFCGVDTTPLVTTDNVQLTIGYMTVNIAIGDWVVSTDPLGIADLMVMTNDEFVAEFEEVLVP